MEKNVLDLVALILLIVGGLNWGLAVFNINLVTMLFGWSTIVVNLVYALVGLSALYTIYYLTKK